MLVKCSDVTFFLREIYCCTELELPSYLSKENSEFMIFAYDQKFPEPVLLSIQKIDFAIISIGQIQR